jgi:hypothetical protein
VTFGAYLRNRRIYTEAGLALREVTRGLPAEIETVQQVRVWLYEQRASLLVIEAARMAAKAYAQVLRKRRERAAGS